MPKLREKNPQWHAASLVKRADVIEKKTYNTTSIFYEIQKILENMNCGGKMKKRRVNNLGFLVDVI